MPDTPQRKSIYRFGYLISLLVGIWLLHLVNIISGGMLYSFGLIPRKLAGLDGLIGAPFLHDSFAHLISNTTGLVFLGGLVCVHSASTFLRVTVFIAIFGGLAVWLLARSGNHIGASGLVFGYFGYLLARGVVEKTPKGLFIATVVAVVYSGLLWGVLPNRGGISWEGHLFGFLAGILAARWRIHAEQVPV